MKYKELFSKVYVQSSIIDFDYEYEDIIYDSRKARPNTIFVAIDGFKQDGHDYCIDAYNKGCREFVVEKKLELPADANLHITANTKKALALMSASFFEISKNKIHILAVTGTKGKTSTSNYIKSILELHGDKVGIIGTNGVFYGDRAIKTENSTPISYELHKFIREMSDDGCKYCVMEATSQGAKLFRTHGMVFDICLFMNLSNDHIGPGEHENFDEYLSYKKMIMQQSTINIINSDDKYSAEVVNKNSVIVSFGMNKNCDFLAKDVKFSADNGMKTEFSIVYDDETINMSISNPGIFSVYNALAAVTMCRNLGVDFTTCAKGIREVKTVGRCELIENNAGITVMIDIAHNEISVKSLFDMLSEYMPDRLIAVFGCGGNRSRDRRFAMGKIIAECADLSVITSDNPRNEKLDDIIGNIMQGVGENADKTLIIPDRREAILHALKMAKKGDIVALVGKGDQQYEEINGEFIPFSERQIVEDYFNLASK